MSKEYHVDPDSDYSLRAVDLEIYEEIDPEVPIIKPNRIRINGVECLTPDNAPVLVEGLIDKTKPLTATITVFIRSLRVHAVGGHES